MKLNISYPTQGTQKYIEIDDERKLRNLYDKRISQEVPGEDLGEEFAGYVFKISGGNDKQGFAMKQGVLTNTRVRLLLREGSSLYRSRRNGERKRKSVRGCIVGADLSVLNLVIVKKGDADIEGLTEEANKVPTRLGPKRATKIRALFNISKDESIYEYSLQMARKFKNKKGKEVKKSQKIQRLVTPVRRRRKDTRMKAKVAALEKSKDDKAIYAQLLARRIGEAKESRRSELSKRRSSRRSKIASKIEN
jgi:ribosomal protein S6E (S10)